MKITKSKKKELRLKYETLRGEEYVRQIQKEPFMSSIDLVDTLIKYK
jgi:hypothetical protein